MAICGHKFLIDGVDRTVRFAGRLLGKDEGFKENDVWVEIPCGLADGHDGKHRAVLMRHEGAEVSVLEWSTDHVDIWLA